MQLALSSPSNCRASFCVAFLRDGKCVAVLPDTYQGKVSSHLPIPKVNFFQKDL